MRDAETVLNVIRDRGNRRLPLEDVYRQLFNPDLYLRAYGRIYRNDGAMTPGTTPETVDGMSLTKINAIIEALRFERYRWTPARRVEIPKKNGKTRPLGLPTWSDKLLQEVMRSLLEAYYDPQFSNASHGFRTGRGCHTALSQIQHAWNGTKWFIEGDIKGCFDNINHDVLMGILRERILDNRFLRLIEGLLKAGYLEWWKYHPSYSGTPQGGVISPILSNIYLDKLDKYVEDTLIPENTRGETRRRHAEYRRTGGQMRTAYRQGKIAEAKELRNKMQTLPCADPYDPNFRRLRYVRYADDFLLSYAGTRAEAETIKVKLAGYLRDNLKLELSDEKTLITHASEEKARFLGYDILTQMADTKRDKRGGRAINGVITLRVPATFIEDKCQQYMRNDKPIHRAELLNDSDFTIVAKYQSEYRGCIEYYAMAQNLFWLRRLHRVMQISLMKTLAHKHKISVAQVAKRYKATRQTTRGPRKCIQVTINREGKKPLIAYFGAISLGRRASAVIDDKPNLPRISGVELLKRLLATKCEICGSEKNVEVHHIRKLADLKSPGRKDKPLWVQYMASRKRKTLVACENCHDDIHAGRPLVIERKPE